MELNNDEIRRYSRHLILPEVGLAGQKKIKVPGFTFLYHSMG
jgi:molybdopterin/thiamine biosynthesis adenylyltransferase